MLHYDGPAAGTDGLRTTETTDMLTRNLIVTLGVDRVKKVYMPLQL